MGWGRDPYSPESEGVAEDEDDDDADQDGRGLLRAALERHGPLMEVRLIIRPILPSSLSSLFRKLFQDM